MGDSIEIARRYLAQLRDQCEAKGKVRMKTVTKLNCKVCSWCRAKKLPGELADRWITGAKSVRTSNIRDHAHLDHMHTMMLWKRERAEAKDLTSVQLCMLPLLNCCKDCLLMKRPNWVKSWIYLTLVIQRSHVWPTKLFIDQSKLVMICNMTNHIASLLFYCLHRKRGPPAATMATPTISQKRPANSPLTEEHCPQPVDIGSISDESNSRFALTYHNPSPRCPLRVRFGWIRQWRSQVTGPTEELPQTLPSEPASHPPQAIPRELSWDNPRRPQD